MVVNVITTQTMMVIDDSQAENSSLKDEMYQLHS